MENRVMEQMDRYIKLVDVASSRGRYVIYVLVVFTALVAIGVWNNCEGSWVHQEHTVLTFAITHLGEPPIPNADPATQKMYETAKLYVTTIGHEWRQDPETVADLNERKRAAQRLIDENYTHFKVPVVGVALHANDIGLLGGFGLLMIVLVLRFALIRERVNIARTFKEARARDALDETYALLSMSQVLSVPPESGVSNQRNWNHVHKGLFALPAVVQACVFYLDLKTLKFGLIISPLNTWTEVIGGCCFLVCIVLLTASCLWQSLQTDRIWKDYAGQLKTGGPLGEASTHLAG